MMAQPNIVITKRDFERLESLVDSLSAVDSLSGAGLIDELQRADLVASQDIPPSVVTMNSQVTFTVLASVKQLTYTLVYPKDMDTSGDKISILAPVGSALLGLSVGQEIEWFVAAGKTTRIRVDSIDYQPERSGDYHL
jgi:regulator of nucleoside diphosphate kinase